MIYIGIDPGTHTGVAIWDNKQQDKEILSPVIESFLPLWKQHIKTMNVMENMLLAELRDALLPALMSGRIELNKDTTMR